MKNLGFGMMRLPVLKAVHPDWSIASWSVRFCLEKEYVTRINDILDFIRKQSSELTVFDEALTRCWVKRIVIYGDKYTIEFKSGISVDVQS